ncbi:MAG TPA: AAA family ATPase, partial [Ochrobactrum intermedium]
MSNFAFEPEDEAPETGRAPIMLENVRPIPRISIQAFCVNESVAIPIERAGGDRRMAKTHLKVMMGGSAASIEFYQTASTPNLIIVESASEPNVLLEELQQLSEVCDPGSKVMVIGHSNEVWLYRELLRRGVSEYIVAPVSLADILAIVSSIFLDPGAEPLGRSIAFIGAKGGVGASTIAHNVAWSISNMFRHDVVLADMDLPFGTANINFDQDPTLGIADAVFSPERIDEVYLDRLLVQYGDHLSILAAPSSLERTFDFAEDAFAELIDVAQRSSPLVVLDVAHGWSGWTRTTLMRVDEVVIVATPDLANLRNTKNLLDTLAQLRPNDVKPHLV